MVQARVGTEGTVGMMVRMSEGLRDRIKAAAEKNGKSQNSEIVATLEEKYPEPFYSEDLLSLFDHMVDLASKTSDPKIAIDRISKIVLTFLQSPSTSEDDRAALRRFADEKLNTPRRPE